jgi:hypothetical protein
LKVRNGQLDCHDWRPEIDLPRSIFLTQSITNG